jgi:hypothetical protein
MIGPVQRKVLVTRLLVAATVLGGCVSSPVTPTPSSATSQAGSPPASPAAVGTATAFPTGTATPTLTPRSAPADGPTATTREISPSPRAVPTSAATPSASSFGPTGWRPFDDLTAGALETIVLDHPGPLSASSGQVVAWNGGFYIGLGEDGGVLTSVDGRQWSDIPGVTAWQVSAAGSRLFGWGGGYWWWTDDGVQWSRREFDRVFTAEEPNYAFVNAVSGAASDLYAVGGIIHPPCSADGCPPCSGVGCPLAGAVWRSDDGEDWERIDIGDYLGPWTQDEEVEWELVELVATPDRLVILGNESYSEAWASWVSADGRDWTRMPWPSAAEWGVSLGGGDRVFALSYRDREYRLLELSDSGWIERELLARDEIIGFAALAETPVGSVLAGTKHLAFTTKPLLWASIDGVAWGSVTAPEDEGWLTSIAATENHIVIAGGVGPRDPSPSNLAFWITP